MHIYYLHLPLSGITLAYTLNITVQGCLQAGGYMKYDIAMQKSSTRAESSHATVIHLQLTLSNMTPVEMISYLYLQIRGSLFF